MAVAMKAAAAAAEDAAKVKSAGSVFDRLGKRIDSGFNGLHEAVEEDMLDDGNNVENTMTAAVYQGHEYQQRTQVHSRLSRGLTDDAAMMDSESMIPSNPATYNEGYDEVQEDARYTRHYASVSTRRKQLETTESDGVSRLSNFERQPIQDQEPQKPHEESVTVKYRLARNSDEVARESRMQKTSLSEAPSSSRKIVNISVNVNTWKSPHFQSARDAVDREPRTSNTDTKILSDHNEMDIDGTLPENSDMRLQAESGQIAPATDPNGISGTDYPSDVRKGTSSVSGVNTSVRPEDADSRTVFVSNVHFAATKEAITKHFSRCGEVVKVIMLTDVATGQPKGSAYIEFSCRETAEIALTLNETSFMSRMLKVVRKNASHVEPSIIARPPLRRPLPYSAWRPTRAVYGRGLASTYRRGYMPRPFGSRSLQWRRDTSSGGTSDNSAPTLNEPPSGGNPAGPASGQSPRPLTYIRNATKLSNENADKTQE
uniref:RRM domain-containing protein n=1 Tax=Picea sitchensis TaxID=3332 RepID=D5A8E5_PICSI|nr:unknown [Picea sitchensis]